MPGQLGGRRVCRQHVPRQESLSILFADDGLVPNNPMPLLVYQGLIDLDRDHPAGTIERVFAVNGWGDMWRNGVYDYLHYHATVHEALGVACGEARVRFGGDQGTELKLLAGDIAILPAGTGHQCISASADFCIVGAYRTCDAGHAADAGEPCPCVDNDPAGPAAGDGSGARPGRPPRPSLAPRPRSGAVEPIQRLQDLSDFPAGEPIVDGLAIAPRRNEIQGAHLGEMLRQRRLP